MRVENLIEKVNTIPDGINLEEMNEEILSNKTSILGLQNELSGQRLKLINSINETIELL